MRHGKCVLQKPSEAWQSKTSSPSLRANEIGVVIHELLKKVKNQTKKH
jgi:hypothetical protein